MDEELHRPAGVPMLVLTSVLKPPQTRIGKLGPVSFGRTVPILTLAAVITGFLLGFAFASVILGASGDAIIYGGGLGAAAGFLAVTWSPLPGESLAKWLGLRALSTRQARVDLHGRPARVFVGIAPISRVAGGPTIITSGAVRVAEGAYDERGVPRVSELAGIPAGAGTGSSTPLPVSSSAGRRRRRGGPGST